MEEWKVIQLILKWMELLKKEKEMEKINHDRFPDIVLPPKKVTVKDYEYTLYKFIFSGLSDLYNYLKAEPIINKKIFKRLESIENSYDFAGKEYDEALEQLISYNDPKYKEFLNLASKSEVKNLKLGRTYQTVYSVAGGVVRPEAIATGSPYIYRTTRIKSDYNVAKFHVAASYNFSTTKKQVYNRAVILTNIIHALEEEGVDVDVNVFETSYCKNELLDIILNIKKSGQYTNYQALYRSLCDVEFLRRILFRVLETADVKRNWSHGYGRTCDEEFMREYLKADKNDFFVGEPQKMGIKGKSLPDDFETAVKKLKLEKSIDVEKAKFYLKDK